MHDESFRGKPIKKSISKYQQESPLGILTGTNVSAILYLYELA